MLGQHACRKAQSLLCTGGAVGPNLNGQLIIVGDLANTGVFHRVVALEHRGINAVHRQGADIVFLNQRLLVALSGNIAAAFIKGQLHNQLSAVAQGSNVPFRVQDLKVIALLDGAGRDFARANSFNADGLGAVAIDLGGNALEVQHDFSHVLAHALNNRELMHDTVDLDAGNCHTGQAGEQHTTQAVAQRGAETAFQRLNNELTITAIRRKVGHLDLGAFNLHHKNPP